MIVYVDIFLLENTILNLIIFISVSIFTNSRIYFFKYIFSSIIGSIYTLFEYYYINNVCLELLSKLIFSFIIVIFTYKGNLKRKIKLYFCFILVSFLYGGITYFIQIFLRLDNYIVKREYADDVVGVFPIKTLIVSYSIGIVIIYYVSKIFNKISDYKKMICDVEIKLDGKFVKIKGLIDSGNLLKDPVTKKDVIIVEEKALKELIDENELEFIKNISNGKVLEDDNNLYSKTKYRIKIIPFNSLGNSNGIICGIQPEYIRIFFEEEYLLKEVILGIYFDKLSCDDEYCSLIGGGCLKEDFI